MISINEVSKRSYFSLKIKTFAPAIYKFYDSWNILKDISMIGKNSLGKKDILPKATKTSKLSSFVIWSLFKIISASLLSIFAALADFLWILLSAEDLIFAEVFTFEFHSARTMSFEIRKANCGDFLLNFVGLLSTLLNKRLSTALKLRRKKNHDTFPAEWKATLAILHQGAKFYCL